VPRAKWDDHGFDDLSVLKVVHSPVDPAAPVYDFFINVDNKYLLHSQKERPANAELLQKQFIYGFVLVGLALLQDRQRRTDDPGQESVEDHVLRTTRALGPILIPMLQAIGSLDEE
jgi:hypothetical protein